MLATAKEIIVRNILALQISSGMQTLTEHIMRFKNHLYIWSQNHCYLLRNIFLKNSKCQMKAKVPNLKKEKIKVMDCENYLIVSLTSTNGNVNLQKKSWQNNLNSYEIIRLAVPKLAKQLEVWHLWRWWGKAFYMSVLLEH